MTKNVRQPKREIELQSFIAPLVGADDATCIAEHVAGLEEELRAARRIARRGSPEEKASTRRRLEAAHRAIVGVRGADGPPYRDARMLLVHLVGTWAACVRADARREHRRWQTADSLAVAVAAEIATAYPSLAERMREPARHKAIEVAIVASAGGARARGVRLAWPKIAACWDNVERQHVDGETLKGDWKRWQAAR